MDDAEVGLPEWPKRVEDVNAFHMMMRVAADAMAVDADKWRLLNEVPFDERTPEQHQFHQLAIQVVLNAGGFVAALGVLHYIDPERAKGVAQEHWASVQDVEVVADLWDFLDAQGVDVRKLRGEL